MRVHAGISYAHLHGLERTHVLCTDALLDSTDAVLGSCCCAACSSLHKVVLNAHTHMHARTHTYMHIRSHGQAHAHNTQGHEHTSMCTSKRTQAHIHKQASTPTHTHTCTYARMDRGQFSTNCLRQCTKHVLATPYTRPPVPLQACQAHAHALPCWCMPTTPGCTLACRIKTRSPVRMRAGLRQLCSRTGGAGRR